MKFWAKEFGIIGAGGWGTAVGSVLARNGHKVLMWAREEEVCAEINEEHLNTMFLPGVELPRNVKATNKSRRLRGCDYYIIATPTQYIRKMISDEDFNFREKPVISVAKGIEIGSLFRVSEILAEAAGTKSENFAVLSGPSHAEEVSRMTPTTVVAASESRKLAAELQELISNETFRVYTTDDVVGCELGGALKNVIALAAGIIDGLELGDNTKAALVTRGLAEMSRLGVALGANNMTFSGLSGLGDMYVTCSSRHSRNRSVGEKIGRGQSLAEIQSNMKMVAEGVFTTKSAFKLGEKHGVEMPIAEHVYKILFEEMDPLDAIRDLMNRQTKREWWW